MVDEIRKMESFEWIVNLEITIESFYCEKGKLNFKCLSEEIECLKNLVKLKLTIKNTITP
jgi:hypothetical protein